MTHILRRLKDFNSITFSCKDNDDIVILEIQAFFNIPHNAEPM